MGDAVQELLDIQRALEIRLEILNAPRAVRAHLYAFYLGGSYPGTHAVEETIREVVEQRRRTYCCVLCGVDLWPPLIPRSEILFTSPTERKGDFSDTICRRCSENKGAEKLRAAMPALFLNK